MTISEATKRLIKAGFRSFGLDIVREKNSPLLTLLGLKQLPIQTIIDVGANTGQFARDILGYFPRAKLYCFEPLPGPFAQLEKWAATHAPNVNAFNLALGESSGEIAIHCHINHTPSSSPLISTALNELYFPIIEPQLTCAARIERLDDVMADFKEPLERDVLLKLDVQGYEDRVLRGATNTLRFTSACIVEIILDTLYEDQASFGDLVLLLNEAGLTYTGNLNQLYASDGHVMWIDAVFRRRSAV